MIPPWVLIKQFTDTVYDMLTRLGIYFMKTRHNTIIVIEGRDTYKTKTNKEQK